VKRSSSLPSRSVLLSRQLGIDCTGSSNPLLPILAAFVFFLLFVALSLWFIARSRIAGTSQQNPVSSGFPTAPPISGRPNSPTSNGALSPGFPSTAGGPPQSSSSSTSPFSPRSSFGSPTQLDAASARHLVESWLQYKRTIFSSPYDISRLDQYVVNPGPLHSDITKPRGSVEWLRSRNSSYFYRDLNILDVFDFRQFPDRAHLTVKILEDLELRTPSGVDRSKSGRKTQSWVYELKLHNGKWLIYDYRKDN